MIFVLVYFRGCLCYTDDVQNQQLKDNLAFFPKLLDSSLYKINYYNHFDLIMNPAILFIIIYWFFYGR